VFAVTLPTTWFFLPKNHFFYLCKTFPEAFWFYFTASYLLDSGSWNVLYLYSISSYKKKLLYEKFHKLARRYLKIYENNIMKNITLVCSKTLHLTGNNKERSRPEFITIFLLNGF
jgi:hypothetical protein